LGKQATGRGSPPLSWDSTRLREIWDVVKATRFSEDQDPGVWFGRLRLLEKMLKQRLSTRELHDVAASCATMPDGEHESEFSGFLYPAMFGVLSTQGDREGLVILFAARYEDDIYPNGAPLERYVASLGLEAVLAATDTAGKGPTFRRDLERAISHGYSEQAVVGKKDAALVKSTAEWFGNIVPHVLIAGPILILTDAYSRSKVPAARHAIAEAVRRAFTGLGVPGNSDDEFVANAAKWYTSHKEMLQLNTGYGVDFNGVPVAGALFTLTPNAGMR
jgi:hypothetical protein